MGRRDYYDDPADPDANSLVPAASAIVVDDDGRILLHRDRTTTSGRSRWPDGARDSVAGCVICEVREETGLDVEPVAIVGIQSDPKQVFSYDRREVRQEFFNLSGVQITGGSLAIRDESFEVEFHAPGDIEQLDW